MHYHGHTGSYDTEIVATFDTKKHARAWLAEEKAMWADFAHGDADLRLFGNIALMTDVGVEGGIAFLRRSYVAPCDFTEDSCEIYREDMAQE